MAEGLVDDPAGGAVAAGEEGVEEVEAGPGRGGDVDAQREAERSGEGLAALGRAAGGGLALKPVDGGPAVAEGDLGRAGVAKDRGVGKGGDDGPHPIGVAARDPAVAQGEQAGAVTLPGDLEAEDEPLPGPPAGVVGGPLEEKFEGRDVGVRAGEGGAEGDGGAGGEELGGGVNRGLVERQVQPGGDQGDQVQRGEGGGLRGEAAGEGEVGAWAGEVRAGGEEVGERRAVTVRDMES